MKRVEVQVKTVEQSSKSAVLLIDHRGSVLRVLLMSGVNPAAERAAVEQIKNREEKKRWEAFNTLYPNGDSSEAIVTALGVRIVPLEEFTYTMTEEAKG
jgi:hypothetical protein